MRRHNFCDLDIKVASQLFGKQLRGTHATIAYNYDTGQIRSAIHTPLKSRTDMKRQVFDLDGRNRPPGMPLYRIQIISHRVKNLG